MTVPEVVTEPRVVRLGFLREAKSDAVRYCHAMVDVREHRQVEVQLPLQLPRQISGLGRQHNEVRR